MGTTRYIMSMGELSRKDHSLCYRKNDKNIYIPIENTKEIYCLNEVSINSKLLDFISAHHIIIHFFNYYGNYSGTFYPREQFNSGRLLIKQVEKHTNQRIEIAQNIVNGIGENLYEILYHYYKHGKKEVKGTIDWIQNEFSNKILQTNDIYSIMSLEGELWQRFYNMFQYILIEEFIFQKRVKRPPDNPINALISFGNTLLYTKTISMIYQDRKSVV